MLLMILSRLSYISFIFTVATAAIAEDEIKIKPSMPWYTTASWQLPAESRINPDNEVQQIPERTGAVDLRPNVKVDWGKFQLVARPQFRGTVSQHKVRGELKDVKRDGKGKWLEIFGNVTLSDMVILSYGRQNYQWGAAESLNPSNHVFHETIESKDLLYSIQGRDLARLNITWNKNVSTIILAETDEIDDVPKFREGESFQRKSLIKQEINWNSGADYFGVVLGSATLDGPWVGEYFNVSLFDGLAFYADASHQRHSQAWYPVQENSAIVPGAKVVELRQTKLDDGKVQTLAVAGLRYSFEEGSDLRFEYILNTGGWTKDENELAMNALDSSQQLQLKNIATNAERFYKPGLEYKGRRYGLTSLRVPDMITKDLTMYLRYLKSLQDFSSSGYVSFEYGFGEASTLLLTALATTGKPDQELRGLVSRSVLAGYRYDF